VDTTKSHRALCGIFVLICLQLKRNVDTMALQVINQDLGE